MRLLILCLLWLPLVTSGQYPQGYFRNPLGIPMQLVANFGEVRSDHFHMGFDLRTNRRENLPVYAAAEGYISRVAVEAGGYGRCLFITHPNGYTTVYAHLNLFFPELQQYLEERQYREESWQQDFRLEPGQFPVSKGQFIASSGNTGSSEGPHLHFEIRETSTGNNLNPLLFGFPVKDNIAPLVYRLFLYDRQYSTYAIDPSEIRIRRSGASYFSKDTLVYTGSPDISFGISAEDLGNTSSFRYGVYAAELWVDSVRQFGWSLGKLNYESSRYVNAVIDYKKRMTSRTLVQHLSRLPGNRMDIFEGSGDGRLQFADTLPHTVMIRVRDITGNHSDLSFRIAYRPSLYEPRFFTQDREKLVPGIANTFTRDNITIDFPSTAIYDTIPFYHAEVGTGHNDLPMHQLHYHYVPLHEPYTVSVKPSGTIGDASRIIWRLSAGKQVVSRKAVYSQGRFTGAFEKFGMLALYYDTVPPRIIPQGWHAGTTFARNGAIRIQVKDDLGQVRDFRAELDGKWLMFSQKGNVFSYGFDARCANGSHELTVRVTDIAGNESVRSFHFELKEKLPVKRKSKKYTRKKR